VIDEILSAMENINEGGEIFPKEDMLSIKTILLSDESEKKKKELLLLVVEGRNENTRS